MPKLPNTLYVQSEDIFMSLRNDNVLLQQDNIIIDRYPLLSLDGIVSFSQKGATVPLMAACASNGISMSFLSIYGNFLFRVCEAERGNVLLRRIQYRATDNARQCINLSRIILSSKVHNSIAVLTRASRSASFQTASEDLKKVIQRLREIPFTKSTSPDSLRGHEGTAASIYFSVFHHFITNTDPAFRFSGRSQRPPMDPVNAMLSFGYVLLSRICTSALECVGLDSCVGFLHQDHSGRASLALDLMEGLRSPMVDRLVLDLINRREITAAHFRNAPDSDGIIMNRQGIRLFLQAWEQKKRDSLTHPVLKEKVEWGLIPFVQAQLLARYLRDELPSYPAFLWR